MTHARNTPASSAYAAHLTHAAHEDRHAGDAGGSDRVVHDDRRSDDAGNDAKVDANENRDDDAGNDAKVDDVSHDDGRTRRARSEPMTVRPLRDRRYVVETDGGVYVVALEAGTCTCPDHAIRGSRCKHLRRVAIEVSAGSVPAPDERVGVCAVCGVETFVPLAVTGPQLCGRHEFDPGEPVRDRETGKRLVVTGVTDARADAYRTEEERTIDDYATNADYGAHEPVVEAVYLGSLKPTRDPADAKRYGFPASRLVRDRL